MKSLIKSAAWIVTLLVIFAGTVQAQYHKNIKVDEIWNDDPCNTTAVDTSASIRLTDVEMGYGYFSVRMKADEDTGTSHIKLQYQLSYDDTNWGFEAGSGAVTTIVADFSQSDFGATEWPIYIVQPMVAKHIRFIRTGLAGNGADIDFYLDLLRHPLQ